VNPSIDFVSWNDVQTKPHQGSHQQPVCGGAVAMLVSTQLQPALAYTNGVNAAGRKFHVASNISDVDSYSPRTSKISPTSSPTMPAV